MTEIDLNIMRQWNNESCVHNFTPKNNVSESLSKQSPKQRESLFLVYSDDILRV